MFNYVIIVYVLLSSNYSNECIIQQVSHQRLKPLVNIQLSIRINSFDNFINKMGLYATLCIKHS